jgi:hypothetical protein
MNESDEVPNLEQLEQDLIAQGYDLEELDQDNPYNQWMYEQ